MQQQDQARQPRHPIAAPDQNVNRETGRELHHRRGQPARKALSALKNMFKGK